MISFRISPGLLIQYTRHLKTDNVRVWDDAAMRYCAWCEYDKFIEHCLIHNIQITLHKDDDCHGI